jgi:peptidyl-dipeptidase A
MFLGFRDSPRCFLRFNLTNDKFFHETYNRCLEFPTFFLCTIIEVHSSIFTLREGANPGFHEAVGDVMALSVQTPAHLKKVGLLPEISSTYESDINFLMKSALSNIIFLPFAFVMDKWMWSVYDGTTTPQHYNEQWWKLRRKYQGIKPPVERTEHDFDAGTKMHTVGDVPYIRYYFARILTFTFHEHACRIARAETGESGPLHHCSIYGSKKAGDALGKLLAYGRSEPWPGILEEFTGSQNISTDSIKEYFKPLTVWFKSYREKEKYPLGWDQE